MRLSIFSLILFFTGLFLLYYFLGPTDRSEKQETLILQKNESIDSFIKKLQDKGYIKHEGAFRFLTGLIYYKQEIEAGGYVLRHNMYAWEIAQKITGKPDLIWITFGACLRKEQIGEILAESLGWEDEELVKWNTVYTESKPEYTEGVYYPDTYLIPVDETGEDVARRMINRFNEKFTPYADDYIAQNIRWTTGLKIASLIAREAAGAEDMHLVSGIIWNRLNIDMPLQIDATMQYTLGKNKDGLWWGAIDIREKKKDSPYNSYLYKGLPPTPICSPSIDYIEAALHPTETSCLFYLHDSDKQIYCAETFDEHRENIKKYLN